MDDSGKTKHGEAGEFWEAAIRLWSESGLSVREFCRREGLAEHSFFAWRRKLLPESRGSKAGREASADGGGRMAGSGRRQRKQVADADKLEESARAGAHYRVVWQDRLTCAKRRDPLKYSLCGFVSSITEDQRWRPLLGSVYRM